MRKLISTFVSRNYGGLCWVTCLPPLIEVSQVVILQTKVETTITRPRKFSNYLVLSSKLSTDELIDNAKIRSVIKILFSVLVVCVTINRRQQVT